MPQIQPLTPTLSSKPMATLELIGGGKLGRTLARLWHQQHIFNIGQIVTRSAASAAAAQQFIGAGTATAELQATVRHTENSNNANTTVWLLAVSDHQLAAVAQQLLNLNQCQRGDIVFHCSGATSSAVLQPLQAQGVHIASVHPVHSFADPVRSLTTFAGSYCAYEGDAQALAILQPAFTHIGGILFPVDAQHKSLYHAGSVIACNYLVALLETALQSFQAAGVERAQACQLLAPIVHQTVDNVLQSNIAQGSSAAALTGPISRGDHTTVAQQLDALDQFDRTAADIYRSLGRQTLAIAREQGQASSDDLNRIKQLLEPAITNH